MRGALCSSAGELYATGRGLTAAEVDRRRQEMSRNIARMRARAADAAAFFEALTFVFYAAHRNWYEVLHNRWAQSVHRAMPEILAVDPVFHRQLETLIHGPDPSTRITAVQEIHRALFGT